MDELIIRHVRCFNDPGPARIAPVTLLVGENSTGKTTFLALARIAWDISFGHQSFDFNEDPFYFGSYEQIAHFRGGSAGRSKSFEVGLKVTIRQKSNRKFPKPGTEIYFHSKFIQSGSQPVLDQTSLKSDAYSLTVRFGASLRDSSMDIEAPSWSGTISLKDIERVYIRFRPGLAMDWNYFLYSLFSMRKSDRGKRKKVRLSMDDFEIFDALISTARRENRFRPFATAPVRSKPLRTYDPVKDLPTSEGSHVPMILAKSYFGSNGRWKTLKRGLDRFGSLSGLFEELRIKTLGKTESDPFQIKVKIAGPAANLIDVGYGVSQILPIVVHSIQADRRETLLLQQPEVHLHPRAQAAFVSFVGQLAKRPGKTFIIETHSDYIIDRLRMDVRDGKSVRPEDVSILFFDRVGAEVKIHNISIDKEGNLQNVPDSYRKFFLHEERRLFKM